MTDTNGGDEMTVETGDVAALAGAAGLGVETSGVSGADAEAAARRQQKLVAAVDFQTRYLADADQAVAAATAKKAKIEADTAGQLAGADEAIAQAEADRQAAADQLAAAQAALNEGTV